MTAYQPEKRRHHRIIFKEPKKIAALVSLLDQEQENEAVASSILNMSAGGIQISVERSALDNNVWRGREILLHCVSGLPELLELADVPMQVVWVMDNEYLDHILIGAAFAALSEEQERILRAFVDNCLNNTQRC